MHPQIYNAQIIEEATIDTSVVERVIIYPLSGYINRLQATASAALLAEDLGAELVVCWDPQPAAASPAFAVFSDDFCETNVVSVSELEKRTGISIDSLPRYLQVSSETAMISLAGHDLGEQHFMIELGQQIDALQYMSLAKPATIVLKAGGNFFLPKLGSTHEEQIHEFRMRRGAWYRNMPLNPRIDEQAALAIEAAPIFSGLHLRYTDRSIEAPTDRQIMKALEQLGTSVDDTSLFIASDVPDKRDLWFARSGKMGFDPWTIEHEIIERSHPRSAQPALIDWRILGSARALVYFAESSFAHEAVVAAGSFDESIGLSAHPALSTARRLGQFSRSAVTWPRRKLSGRGSI